MRSMPAILAISSVTTSARSSCVAHAHHDHEVVVARDRVDLGDLGQVGDRLSGLGDLMDVADGEDDGGDHACPSRR